MLKKNPDYEKPPVHNEQPTTGIKVMYKRKKDCFASYLEKRARDDEEERRTGKIKD